MCVAALEGRRDGLLGRVGSLLCLCGSGLYLFVHTNKTRMIDSYNIKTALTALTYRLQRSSLIAIEFDQFAIEPTIAHIKAASTA